VPNRLPPRSGCLKFGLRVNLLEGKDEPGLKNYHGRRNLASAAFDFRLTDSLTFRADIEKYQKKSTEQAAINLISTATVLPHLPPNNRVNYGPEDASVLDARSTNALARIDWAVTENWNITADYGIVHASRNRAFPSFTFNSLAAYTTGDGFVSGSYFPSQAYENKNGRIDLSGRIETGPVAHEVTLGYTRNSRFQDGSTGAPANFSFNENYFAPAQPTTPLTPPKATTPVTSIQVDRGLYAVDRIIVSKQLHIMMGVRRTNYYSSNLLPVVSGAGTVNKTTPSASVIFKPTPNNSIYASYLKGLEAGTAVQASFLNGNQLLPAGTSTQTELGYKHQLGGLLVQGALFEIKKAFPTTLIDPNVCGAAFTAAKTANPLLTGFTVNGQTCASSQQLAGEQRFRGVEMAASGDLNRNLGVVASALFMQPKITKDSTPAPSPNYQGKEPGNTSKQTASLFAEYRPDALPGLGLNAGIYYTGRRPAHNSNNVYLPSFTLLAVGARYRTQFGSTAATFQLNVDNAANRNYWAAADATNASPIVSTGLPRLIRATAKLDF
jgi:iron complex outermembrane receptor protein